MRLENYQISDMEDITKTIMFTTNTIQNGQPTIQYQTADGTILKQPKIEGQKNQQDYPTFCYTTTNGNATTVNLAQLTTDDNKTCYIAQPIGGYNYALVNQMQLNQGGTVGIATVDNQGRLQVINKPIAANTISNISFKCDVCGLMFSHLTLLNHHKRIHAQDGSDANQDQIAVVNAQGLVQTQNIITENGQPLGQIQIVATESLEPATSHSMQQTANEVTVTTAKTLTLEKSKCISCGGQILQPTKRKGPKIVRCDNCANNDNANGQMQTQTSQATPTQIFVAPDGEIKFEMNEIPSGTSESSMDSLNAQNIIPMQQGNGGNSSNGGRKNQHQHQQQEIITENGACNDTMVGHHPVKKRNLATVTKCQKCNGSGVIFVGGSQRQVKSETPKPFTCNICGGTFSRYSSLWSHKKLHSGEKNYKCTICGLAFAKAVYLKNHARIHTGEKPYKCQTCGMQFSQSPHLKNHERTHSGEKPYVCEVCDKGFARHATLWNHRRIHTGEKPYKCDICGSAFSQAAHLKNHAKVHSGEKPFKCDICSAAFADRFALKRHRGIHEKYGQTAPRHSQLQNHDDQGQITQSMVIHKQEMPEMDDEAQHEVIIAGL
ncbi:zinc finger protein 665 isoform X1 [Episyrphus balteatus]|uniref:zinc finger protein 665 isoform X1 n=2 Tax=Episyrphus balteatus TaxID=286459 RepID=UPI0024863E16|nr:zinc finger protein 665 isoform X1 [Episyrphus balteatus]XP_055857494.1 zinc finger protein 665 isoform X1 [Episyrphus balteatus]XP_055857495.1 zinc finger protein 665 isoform X1 [Episyrphus balteatus]